MQLRVIDFGHVSALRSQAVYHGLAMAMREGDDPVLSIATPETPYVCVGLHQEIAREVDEDYCREHDLPVYRRKVGGGAVYLDANQMFTHFVYPHAMAPQFAVNLYPLFIEPVVRTYRDLGVNAEYRPINDIQVAGRKIGGTGAASIGEATVMVGSFMFDFDTDTMAHCLKVPSEKFRDKLKTTLQDYMTTMKKELDTLPDRAEVKRIFLAHCAEVLGIEVVESEPTHLELSAIAEAEEELASEAFIYREGRKFVEMGVKIAGATHLTESTFKAPGGLVRTHLVAREGKIADLMITGDFTCLPADGIDQIAADLVGTPLEHVAIAEAANAALRLKSIEMPGVTADDIATAIMEAVETGD